MSYFIFLILKSDFRFVEDIYCCGDDHDYYMHAETISQDFDFDYNNQFLGIEDKRYNNNNKIAPIGFFVQDYWFYRFYSLEACLIKFLSLEKCYI